MKKIVPFKKDITFDMSIAEISSISLEHTLKLKEDNLISGQFIVSGTYKMTEASINVDPFEYKLPFDISIDKKYDSKNVSVDINDFYYEIINNQILSINIEVSLDGLEEREEITLPDKEESREEIEEITEEEITPVNINQNEIANPVKSIFEDLDENERYAVYKVHMVSENDTVESIMQEYEINRETLETYNDLNDLKIGDKLIIPGHEN